MASFSDHHCRFSCSFRISFLHFLICGALLISAPSKANEHIAKRIQSVKDLHAIRLNPYGKYELTKDINFNGANWIPFKFCGEFSGKGKTISNFRIDQPRNTKIGFFSSIGGNGCRNNGRTANPAVFNFKLKNFSITGNDTVGGLVGIATGSRISFVDVQGVVNGRRTVGGIAGIIDSLSLISNSTFSGQITAKSVIGGAFGSSESSVFVNISSEGRIYGSNLIGGICGISNNSLQFDLLSSTTIFGIDTIGGIIGKFTDTRSRLPKTTNNLAQTKAIFSVIKDPRPFNDNYYRFVTLPPGFGDDDDQYIDHSDSIRISARLFRSTFDGNIFGSEIIGGIIATTEGAPLGGVGLIFSGLIKASDRSGKYCGVCHHSTPIQNFVDAGCGEIGNSISDLGIVSPGIYGFYSKLPLSKHEIEVRLGFFKGISVSYNWYPMTATGKTFWTLDSFGESVEHLGFSPEGSLIYKSNSPPFPEWTAISKQGSRSNQFDPPIFGRIDKLYYPNPPPLIKKRIHIASSPSKIDLSEVFSTDTNDSLRYEIIGDSSCFVIANNILYTQKCAAKDGDHLFLKAQTTKHSSACINID